MTLAQPILDRIVRAADEDGFSAHAAHVLVGDDEAEHHWSDDDRRNIHSVSKGVCALAIGVASDEGLVDVDAPVSEYLPDLAYGDGADAVTLRHLLQMTSGIDLPWSETLMTDWPDLAAEFLSRPSRGRVFQYSNASTYTAMRVLQAVTGDAYEWTASRVLRPLGIADPPWDRCPNGWVEAGGGLRLTLAELSRIGRLVRDEGAWEGRRVVSAEWIRAMLTDEAEHDAEPAYRRYALSVWGGPGDARRMHGAYGQLVVFLGDAVVTVLADDHMGADRMAERIVAALEDARGR